MPDELLRQSQAEAARLQVENQDLRARLARLQSEPATTLVPPPSPLDPLRKIARESSDEEDTGRRVLALPRETMLILLEHGGKDWRHRIRMTLACDHCVRKYGGGT